MLRRCGYSLLFFLPGLLLGSVAYAAGKPDALGSGDGLTITIDNHRNMKFCELVDPSEPARLYSSLPFGPCEDSLFDGLEFAGAFKVPSRYVTRDLTVFYTGLPALDMKRLFVNTSVVKASAAKTSDNKVSSDNFMDFIRIGRVLSNKGVPAAFINFSVAMNVGYQWNAGKMVFVLENTVSQRRYIMASSSGDCDVPCLKKTLARNIELPSADWVLTQSIAAENIVVSGESASFVKDNLNNNYLLMP